MSQWWLSASQHTSPDFCAYIVTFSAELFGFDDQSVFSRPKKYCVPSVVVTFQYTPPSSPFLLADPAYTCSMRQPWSSCIRYWSTPVASDRKFNGEACPPRLRVKLRPPQHRLPTRSDWVHGVIRCSTYGTGRSQPNPTDEDWLFSFEVNPSTDPES